MMYKCYRCIKCINNIVNNSLVKLKNVFIFFTDDLL